MATSHQADSPLKAAISTSAKDIFPDEPCVRDGAVDPCTIVIMGASGDLTSRKIVPALFNLFKSGVLPEPCRIMGCARTRMTTEVFRGKMKEACGVTTVDADEPWRAFSSGLYYHTLDYHDPASYTGLAESLRTLDREKDTRGNRIFYLAVPPSLYTSSARMLGISGLSREYSDGNGWARIVVEKPFGRDLPSAIELDSCLHEHFQEHQIFRIDHYLAKETVQNIIMLRFANAIFEPVWNRNYIDHVEIIAAESVGVAHRAGYYEQAGVLRDMFQNHMMQLLALTAMEPPSLFEADRVRDEKVKVYRSLRPFRVNSLSDYLVLGQYGAGEIDGRPVPAYRDEPGVDADSLTPTFAMIKVFLDNWRWKGVPFYLTSGKRLKEKLTQVRIQFKEVPHSMFSQTLKEDIIANQLILGIYPNEKISLTFQTKNPGARVCLRSVNMDFDYKQGYTGPVFDAYEKAFIDCIQGDHMLYWRQDGVELCWSFLTPILFECEQCAGLPERLIPYPSGTWGPPKTQRLMPNRHIQGVF